MVSKNFWSKKNTSSQDVTKSVSNGQNYNKEYHPLEKEDIKRFYTNKKVTMKVVIRQFK